MRAELTENGMLHVFADTPMDIYALRKWHADNAVGLQDGSAVFKGIVILAKDLATAVPNEVPKLNIEYTGC